MIVEVSQVVVLIFGMVICGLSAWGIFAPEKLVKIVKSVMNRDLGIHVAVIVRVLLGVALILAAEESRFPAVFQALGWIAILATVIIAFVGRERLRRVIAWFDRFSPTLVRVWLLFGIAFGGFLIYGVV
ncbi:MAG: hypothetical protein ACSLE2_04725 [Lysobacterales bacterium]